MPQSKAADTADFDSDGFMTSEEWITLADLTNGLRFSKLW